MANKRKKDPFKIVLIITVILGILGAGCIVGSNWIRQQRAERLQVLTDQVITENAESQAAYEQALEEFESEQEDGTNQAWPSPKGEGWEVVDLTNYPLESVSTRTINRQDALYNGMLLVNEWHSRPSDFLEDSLVSVSKATDRKISVRDNNVRLFPDAVQALQDAITDAKGANLENYVAYEGYRSWDEQNNLFQKQMEKYNNLSEEERIEKAKKSVNYPGTSEFNTGLTTRVILYKAKDNAVNSLKFFESEQGIWLYNNSWKYGIVFRFPLADYPVKGTADKSYKTGVSVQLQAFRYVGKGNAAVMHALDLCLEEYLDYLNEHPHIAVFENGALKYEIVRENVGNGDPFTVHVTTKPGVKNTVTSLDNMGYAVTVFEY
ncbi:MAG: D-alanyl-D-alanine carboxypeptidase family protein [Clostridia bacterium]|jgi:LAS superfamily LD-carboxypeptidase LdcB|nr:D-alanyl-D-alanine carboxypeptidase family protein [Clostridia bacterium]MBQ9288578.1 D-alanyl-D-alanine carboxypeptidase family protein [Clostridia bacterium]MBR0215685.1 D-alanyl-D-alanine carboxypeptidase family protein [Clostridia bacterium]